MEPSELAALHTRLQALGATVAVAESLTGGLVTAALTETPGASATVRGGLVVYATELKAVLAGVDVSLLELRGAVDPEVATELARGARLRLGATIGIGVTGVAGPDPQDGQPVGTVFVAATTERSARVEEWHLDGDRAAVRAGAVAVCLDLLADVADELAEARGLAGES
ncbi:CinA family protein [Jatrophihabitans sp.]|uniref:CinA family protein n=1 Tax=Jatrophihabitans sp. TaxID=1932789 RepID=UPI0030C70E69|nr:C-terminal domain of CinA type [Jatrophihabitans sp.]